MNSTISFDTYPIDAIYKTFECTHHDYYFSGNRVNIPKKFIKREIYHSYARNIPNSDDILIYNGDPTELVRFKHFLLGIEIILTMIPRVIQAALSYLITWFQGAHTKPADNPIHVMGHLLSLLRWNFVGLVFPRFARAHFGDEERTEHIANRTCRELTFYLQNPLTLKERTGGIPNIIPFIQSAKKYPYLAPCFQPFKKIPKEAKDLITSDSNVKDTSNIRYTTLTVKILKA